MKKLMFYVWFLGYIGGGGANMSPPLFLPCEVVCSNSPFKIGINHKCSKNAFSLRISIIGIRTTAAIFWMPENKRKYMYCIVLARKQKAFCTIFV